MTPSASPLTRSRRTHGPFPWRQSTRAETGWVRCHAIWTVPESVLAVIDVTFSSQGKGAGVVPSAATCVAKMLLAAPRASCQAKIAPPEAATRRGMNWSAGNEQTGAWASHAATPEAERC